MLAWPPGKECVAAATEMGRECTAESLAQAAVSGRM